MKKCLTQDKFLEKLYKTHGDVDWKIGTYFSLRDKIKVIDKYGECLIQAGSLLRGSVPNVKSAINKTMYSKNKFLEIWKDKYSYNNFIYYGAIIKSTITCKIHGDFEQTPNSHLNGCGCLKCGHIISKNNTLSNIEDFIKKAYKVHGNNKFDYTNSVYLGAIIPMEIGCKKVKEHGTFWQKPNIHLDKSGCPKCALEDKGGYSRSNFIKKAKEKECTFYILKLYNDDEEFYKIGITCNSVKERYPKGIKMPYKYEIIKEIKSFNAGEIWDLELKNKRLLKDFKYTPKIKFKGAITECFSIVNLLLKSFV